MSETMPTLQVEDLKTHFFTKGGVAKAVDGVSFSIHKGEVMGLVGESGSGKTVTGFSIIGLVDPRAKWCPDVSCSKAKTWLPRRRNACVSSAAAGLR